MAAPQGYLALVLHAHLPYVRHPEDASPLEENWLFEAITESYIPLLLAMEGLVDDGIDFRLTLSMTPTLATMLLDPLLQSRYLKKLEGVIELAEKEIGRTERLPDFHQLALMYHDRFLQVHEAFVNRYRRNLPAAFKRLQGMQKVEIIASAATHGYLPLLSANESAVRAQIRVGVDHYRRVFGRSPVGFWLPECGYYPGVDCLLGQEGIRYTILETHGITRADRRPVHGVHAPIVCPSGVAAFGRDPDCSKQVWSSVVGYPGDFDYREFYRDIGYDLDLDYIGPYIHPSGIRIDTGIKYYRITGKGEHKAPYVREWAEQKAAVHAEHFLSERIKQVRHLSASMDRNPICVAPYDAELFGHWWFEGPRWIDHLMRKIALEQNIIRPVTLSEYLERYPANQTATPCMSSWGHNGFSEVWLSGQNDWIYRHLHMGATSMERRTAAHPQPSARIARALNQAARELLLAQASDWAFMIKSGAMEEYATRRTKTHLSDMHRLGQQIDNGEVDETLLHEMEMRDNIFADIPAAQAFAVGTVTPPVPAAPEALSYIVAEPEDGGYVPPLPLKIAMASSEIVPFAKTGGLADMVSALSTALEGMGHEVCVIVPAHRSVLQNPSLLRDTRVRISVPVAGRKEEGLLLTATIGKNIPIYFIKADRYFNRPFLYGDQNGDYRDNAERFVFFARGVLEVLRQLGRPQILHAHDWQAALAIPFIKCQPELYPGLTTVHTVLTIHNLGYQGLFPVSDWELLNMDWSLYTPRHLEFHGKINFLKGAIAFADAVMTVSPTYSREIQTPENGFGLDGVLRERSRVLFGILNGADYEVWNPEKDLLIAQHFGWNILSGKQLCKADLQRTFALRENRDTPLIGMISRLVPQKGIDLLLEIVEELLRRDLEVVLLGTGDRVYEDSLRTIADRHAGSVGVHIGFDDALAHKIEAGCDIFVMPSRYEPGGLNQLYSLKYGSIPVVRATGGLKDCVEEFDPSSGRGNGFVFESYDGRSLLGAIDRALAAFRRPQDWETLMKNAMTADFSWNRSAREYVAAYRSLLSGTWL